MASSDLMNIHREGFCFPPLIEMRALLNVFPVLRLVMLHHFMDPRPVADCDIVCGSLKNMSSFNCFHSTESPAAGPCYESDFPMSDEASSPTHSGFLPQGKYISPRLGCFMI